MLSSIRTIADRTSRAKSASKSAEVWALLGMWIAWTAPTAPSLSHVASAFGQTITTAQETVTSVQVHGNLVTPDDEVRRLAGLRVGMPLQASTIADATERLRASGRFKSVQVLKRFASIADPSQIVLVVIVDEGAVHIEMTGDPDHPTRVVRNRAPRLLVLPVLGAEDGYGVTYGARLAWPNPAGARSRPAFPVTWGGGKRAAAEVDQTIQHSPIDRVSAGAPANANRTDLDARGYVGLFGQNIVAVRAQRHDSNRPLPQYLQPLLGGMANLRGFRAGTAAGDTLVATSAELIVPLSPVLDIVKVGVSAFVDSGTAYTSGERFADQR